MPAPVKTRLDKNLKARLVDILGKRYVLTEPEELLVYDCDACTLVKRPPEAVLLPATPEEVSAIIKLCLQHRIPYVARGAGTGLSGGAIPIEGGFIISLVRMNRVLAIDEVDRLATVEVGVVNAWLNRDLAKYNLFYAPDPSSQGACTIGGNVAENAGGIHCIKYGVTTDHVLAVEVVLPDGRITWLGGKTRRSHGLNLTGLMVGSEGTLAIVTKVIVRLLKKPQTIRVYLAAFDQTADATNTVSELVRTGFTPGALEFIDAFTVKAVNQAFHVGFPETSQAVLLIELSGTLVQVEMDEARLKAVLTKNSATEIRTGESEEERLKLWKARKGAVAAYGRYYPAFYLHDTVIPRSELTNILEKIEAVRVRHDVPVGNVFHVGDGNLHPNLLFDPADEKMLERVMAAGEEILEACLEVGGTLSGEHGIGLEKSALMTRVFSQEDLQKMKDVKAVFDPENLANPSKIFPIRKGCGETGHAMTHQMLIALSNKGFEDNDSEALWI